MAEWTWTIELKVDVAGNKTCQRINAVVAKVARNLVAEADLAKLDDPSRLKPRVCILTNDNYTPPQELSLAEDIIQKGKEQLGDLPGDDMVMDQEFIDSIEEVADRIERPTKR